MSTNDVILEVKDLQTYFFNRRGVTKAVDGISFSLRQGETLGIVGESGCGKTQLCLASTGMQDLTPGVVDGRVLFYVNNKKMEGIKQTILINQSLQLRFVIMVMIR